MNRLLVMFLLSGAASLGLAGCGGSDPESQLQSVNELRAKDFPLTNQEQAEIERLVAEGTALAKAGNAEQASAAFDQAMNLLKRAQDANAFNKSE